MASGGKEASSLEAAAVAGSNLIARIATVIATGGATKSTEQFLQTDPREVKQVTSGSATEVASIARFAAVAARIAGFATIAARIAWTAVACIVAWSAIIVARIAGTAAGIAAAIQTEAFEQTFEFELRSATGIACIARKAVSCIVARGAIGIARIARTARSAVVRGKQTTQASTEVDARSATDIAARVAIGNNVAWVASNNGLAGLAATKMRSVDQFFETGKQIASFFFNDTATTEIYTRRVARKWTRKTLNTQQQGDNEGRHQYSDFHGVISPFRYVCSSHEEPFGLLCQSRRANTRPKFSQSASDSSLNVPPARLNFFRVNRGIVNTLPIP
jgi:hypothetical protein